MAGPAYHGWTHRPMSEGGTDPIPVTSSGLKWARAQASAQSITPSSGDYFFTWSGLWSNDSALFEVVDVTASRGDWVQVNSGGYYLLKCRATNASGAGVWDNTFYTTITPMMELSGSQADLPAQLDVPDFGGDKFNSSSEMMAGETAHKMLYQEQWFHYNPDAPVNDIDFEDPLKLSFRVETVGATAAQLIQADMFLMRIADPGYTDLSPA